MRRFCDDAIQDFFQRVDSFSRDRVFIVHQMHFVGMAPVLLDSQRQFFPALAKRNNETEIGRLWLEDKIGNLQLQRKKFPRATESTRIGFRDYCSQQTHFLHQPILLLDQRKPINNKRGVSSRINALSDVTFMTFISCRPAAQRK